MAKTLLCDISSVKHVHLLRHSREFSPLSTTFNECTREHSLGHDVNILCIIATLTAFFMNRRFRIHCWEIRKAGKEFLIGKIVFWKMSGEKLVYIFSIYFTCFLCSREKSSWLALSCLNFCNALGWFWFALKAFECSAFLFRANSCRIVCCEIQLFSRVKFLTCNYILPVNFENTTQDCSMLSFQ